MSIKSIIYDTEARSELLKGVETVVKAVGATLGPKGRNIAIEKPYGLPRITKDGVTVAKEIERKGYEGVGVKMIKEVASKSADNAGDGTTTATVLAGAIAREGVKLVSAGMNPMDLKRGIERAVELVVEDLKKKSKPVTTNEEIQQIATISANGDIEIGKMIAKAMEKVGKEGVITVEENKSLETELEIVEGMQFDRGYLSPYFVTDQEKMVCEFDNPLILVYDGKLSALNPLLPVLEEVAKSGKPLIIIADEVEGEALAILVVNKLRGGLKLCAIKAPGYGDKKKEMLQDISILTKSEFVSNDLGMKLENVTIKSLGSAKKVKINKEETIIVNGAGDKKLIDERCESIRQQITDAKSDYDKTKLQERLAKISGGVAVIKVGGATEVEVKEKKDRVDDALHATKAAVEEGIIAGGGVSLLYSSRAIDLIEVDNTDQVAGLNIVCKALQEPVRKIVENAGDKGDLVVGKLLDQKDTNFGYNAQTGKYVDMVKEGIIDPTKVARVALQNAASVASLLITTEGVIIDDPIEKEKQQKQMNPQMGGMM